MLRLAKRILSSPRRGKPMGSFRIDWPAIELLLITIIAFAIGLAG
jgi:hypothetical protein